MIFAVSVAVDATLSIVATTSLLLSSTRLCVGSPVVKKLATRASTISVEPRQGAVSMQFEFGKREEEREDAERSVECVVGQCKE